MEEKWISSIAVFVLTFPTAFLMHWLLAFLLRNYKKTNSKLDDNIYAILKRPIFYLVLLAGFFISLQLLLIESSYVAVFNKILISVFFIIAWVTISRLIKAILDYLAHEVNGQKLVSYQTIPIFVNISSVLLILLFSYLILESWGIDMTALLTSAGIIGLAVGFAAKDTLANLVAGIFILIDQPYKIGDCLLLDDNKNGVITNIGIRSTRIITSDDIEMIVPNSKMGNSQILNESGGPYGKYNLRLQTSFAFGADLAKSKQILLDIAKNHEKTCDYPAPQVTITNLNNNNLQLELSAWINNPLQREAVLDELKEEVYQQIV